MPQIKMKKRERKVMYLVCSTLTILLLVSTVSAGLFDWVKETITGKATDQSFDLNITVGAPSIYEVHNESDYITLNENGITDVTINFSVYAPTGADNLNHSTALVNLSYSGEDLRQNGSCYPYELSGDYANYTCNITMWWWDLGENWAVNAYIEDNDTSSAVNTTVVQEVGNTTSFIGGPGLITWGGISPGATNRTSNNDPYLINNTGNVLINYSTLKINATHLRGEKDDTEALWAGNFSVSWQTNGGDPPAECGGASMEYTTFTALLTANLSRGNYTLNDGSTGQEQLYFCIKETGVSLSTQPYSTSNESAWTIDISGVV